MSPIIGPWQANSHLTRFSYHSCLLYPGRSGGVTCWPISLPSWVQLRQGQSFHWLKGYCQSKAQKVRVLHNLRLDWTKKKKLKSKKNCCWWCMMDYSQSNLRCLSEKRDPDKIIMTLKDVNGPDQPNTKAMQDVWYSEVKGLIQVLLHLHAWDFFLCVYLEAPVP